ncbi:hypothetical protein HNR59_002014 [Aquamicrobium lusatiense]|uniref:Uncharacterized protein n=1 Tax=Aquamicrobium lusatiense TaxID=89772 RepID=A0A7W9S2F9_9HYPH|nr:hypothetical protein [Aquamicrobium lusatiense]MBB6012669.1 hypothetical protein [Aquamicrobium lusatiense]
MAYPVERGAISQRAPVTSSTEAALIESRGWLAQMIMEAVDGEANGFRGGWISTSAVQRLLSGQRKTVASRSLGQALEELGYYRIGKAGRGWMQDDPANPTKRPWLWNTSPNANLADYGRAQGYE